MRTGERLKEERERLGFNQADFAALAGATRKTLFNWESGAASPNAAALAAWAEAGLDVLYVVTGQRTGGSTAAPAPALAPDEEILLDNYRNCPPDARAAIKTTSDALARASGGCKRDKAA